jgi:hypothetical protein
MLPAVSLDFVEKGKKVIEAFCPGHITHNLATILI